MTTDPISGGCQCGAVRFRVGTLGESSICHGRMCQKAFGSFYAPLVTARELTWTRGASKLFQSSNKVKRGFCAECGTPLTYDYGSEPKIAIGALDHPELSTPIGQVCVADKLPFVDGLADLPAHANGVDSDEVRFMATIKTYQHPETDTDVWPPANAQTD